MTPPPPQPKKPKILHKEQGLKVPPEIAELLEDRQFCIIVKENREAFTRLIDAGVRSYIKDDDAMSSGHTAIAGKLLRELCRQIAKQGEEFLNPK